MWLNALLALLGPLLMDLVRRWMANRGTDFNALKSEYLNTVSSHPRLHKRKLEVAAALFDKVAAKVGSIQTASVVNVSGLVEEAGEEMKHEAKHGKLQAFADLADDVGDEETAGAQDERADTEVKNGLKKV